MRRSYIQRIGTIISQSTNVILFNGHPDESISARCHREKRFRCIDVIDFIFGYGHCWSAHRIDLAHAEEILKRDST